MGKKKSSRSKVMSVRVKPTTHKRLTQLVDEFANPEIDNPSAMATYLIEWAIKKRKEDEEEALLRLLTHFEERMTERLITLNSNLQQAAGMLLIPRPEPEEEPDPELLLENWTDVNNWIKSLMKPIPD